MRIPGYEIICTFIVRNNEPAHRHMLLVAFTLGAAPTRCYDNIVQCSQRDAKQEPSIV
jgi:hypothetical protein